MEEWKDIVGYEGLYKISNFGNAMSVKKNMLLTGRDSRGYRLINLYNRDGGKTFKMHFLVARAFVSGFSDALVVNHIDSNRSNNNYNNLEWCTQSQNISHARNLGRYNDYGCNSKNCNITQGDVRMIRDLCNTDGFSQLWIAKAFKISQQSVSRIHKRYRHGISKEECWES